ncbi:BolA-like protein [Colletotrichum higginsianum]|uniref:BolA-like protein n=2 Tax=Colletotrichum higginsianum TaxID=80884 RepID=H1VBF1_COLHI|nr:BolA-like protein [Colletotrichum higginsianum IMI 349063]OBR14668.1 BolA-like protein [Colletotrichum higginsianum IMI 349063]TID01788.1 Altered inheritance of mitochondria protein 1 [Colletotrichum higginsianum]CCF37554.1 BolA-like protein [Colletotrichum higginsianum]
MLCRSCRRAIAVAKPASNTIARASAASLPIATRNYSSQRAATPRSSPSSVFVYRPSLHITQTAPTRSYSAETSPSTPSIEKPDHLDAAESTIWDKLVAEFAPSELVVQDVSGGCGSMYAIDITSTKFKGANMLKQQRMVNAVLGDMLKQWHGVQLRTKAP